jgi:hypothetical protein
MKRGCAWNDAGTASLMLFMHHTAAPRADACPHHLNKDRHS